MSSHPAPVIRPMSIQYFSAKQQDAVAFVGTAATWVFSSEKVAVFFGWLSTKPVLAWLCGVATLIYVVQGILIRRKINRRLNDNPLSVEGRDGD
jgi:hypothetical protein